ncbi:MAG: SBBP repeat-containing protein [Promethearchaeota archaeon]
MALILILCFSFLTQGLTVSNEKNDINNKSTLRLSSTSNSVKFSWYCIWDLAQEGGEGVAVDSSGNIYLVGWTYNATLTDMVLVKYDSSGVQQWNRTWGGSISDGGEDVAVDSSDNVYLAGKTSSFGEGDYDMVLVKYDSSGVQQWNRTWGGSIRDDGYGVAFDSSDNVYLVGSTFSYGEGYDDIVLVKYNSSGVQQWNRTWGGSGSDGGRGVAVDSSDNVYLSGETKNFGEGNYDMVLVKYDSSGVQQWNRTWGGSSSDEGTGVAVDSSDNLYLSGSTESFGEGNYDIVLVKYDGTGVQQWNRTWGGIIRDESYGVAVDSANRIYLAGRTNSFGEGSDDIVLVKYDSSGMQQGDQTWGGVSGDGGTGVAIDSSNNVYLSGYTESYGGPGSSMALVKYVQEQGISSYNLFLFIIIIGAITVITAISLKKKYYKKFLLE